MAPRKRKLATFSDESGSLSTGANHKKCLTKATKERNNSTKRLHHAHQNESFSTEDRFSLAERKSLLEAYDTLGFQAFQDMQLLQTFLPNRTENDLRGLLDRLCRRLQDESNTEDRDDHLDNWQRLSQSMMGNFAKDKKVNLDEALSDALLAAADEFPTLTAQESTDRPDYSELLKSFAQLLRGRFPDNMTPANGRISMRLFDHINGLVDGVKVVGIEDGAWLDGSVARRRARQEMAQAGLDELEGCMKKCPSLRDIERSRNVEALSLELPKLKRVTELLNPLDLDEALVSGLTDSATQMPLSTT